MDKVMVYLAMGNIKTYCDYLEYEAKQKDIAEKIREELETIRKYLLEV